MPHRAQPVVPLFSSEQYRFIVDSLPDPVAVYRDGRIVYANPAAAAIAGAQTPGQILGKLVIDFVPSAYRSAFERFIEVPLNGLPTQPAIMHFVRQDGKPLIVRLQAFPMDYNGHPSVLLIGKDLTAEKVFERSLHRSERTLRRMVQLSPEAIVLHANDIVYYVNDSAVRMFKARSAADLIGRNIYDHILPEQLAEGQARIARARTSKEGLSFTVYKMIRIDGELFDAEVSSVGIHDIENANCVQTTLRDVTERVAQEERLRTYSESLERLIKFMPEPIVITDMGQIVYCNKSTVKLVRMERTEDIVGHSIFRFIHPGDHEASAQVVRDIMQTEEPSPFQERRLVCGDGSVISVEISSIQIHDYKGKSVTLSVLRDLTERKQSEEMLLRSEKLSFLGQLAAGVAHEIRNPLTSLRGFTQLLRRDLVAHKQHYLDTMLSEIDRINLIVNDFMSLSKPQMMSIAPFGFADMLRSVLFVLESETILHNVLFAWDACEELPPVLCDEHRIKQVFLNVLKNAIDAMPQGGTIHLAVMRSEDRAIARIRDEGPGIPKEFLPKIGEPFFTTKSTGTGLGLMICHRILESHGGTLKIDSTPGEGTTVSISLPCVE